MIPLPHAQAPVRGRVVVPGSKSETNRALVLAALSDAPSSITGGLRSRDCDLMVDALRSLGCTIDVTDAQWMVSPAPAFRGTTTIECGLAGTVMRFVPPLALLADGPVSFRGDSHASERPMAGLLDGIRQLGGDVDGDRLPFTVSPGGDTGSDAWVTIDAGDSSQFVSGLLLVGARLPGGLRLRHRGATLPSLPHIRMTIKMLRDRGVVLDQPDLTSWEVREGPIGARDQTIEPDLTNASVFLAAAAATAGSVTVAHWPEDSIQPGGLFLDVVRRMGAEVDTLADGVRVTGSARLHGVDVDLHDASELTPVVAALGALADGTTTIRGVAHIRGHETDRLAALTREFERLGIDAHETDDGLTITGGLPGDNVATEFQTYADHRLVHAAALLALRQPGLHVDDFDCVSKTMPDFGDRWRALVEAA